MEATLLRKLLKLEFIVHPAQPGEEMLCGVHSIFGLPHDLHIQGPEKRKPLLGTYCFTRVYYKLLLILPIYLVTLTGYYNWLYYNWLQPITSTGYN